jgi:hypothetical protein
MRGVIVVGLFAAVVMAITVAMQAVTGCLPIDAQTLAQDPTVSAAFDQAWHESLEGTPDEHEEGGWIYRCRNVNPDDPSEWVIVIDWWPPGDVSSITPTPISTDPNCQLLGWFHTHPGPHGDHPENDGYLNEKPSVEDVEFSEEYGVPGYLIHGSGPNPADSTIVPFGPPEAKVPCDPDGASPGGGGAGTAGSSGSDGAGDPGGGTGSGAGGTDGSDSDGAGPGGAGAGPDGPDPGGGRPGGGTGKSAGDPHLLTFDGYPYEFQAAGEFVLVRSLDGEMEIQARQEPSPTNAHVTDNTAVAVRIAGSVVELGADRVVVDGEELPPDERLALTTPGGGTVTGYLGRITLTWPDGSEAVVLDRTVLIALEPEHAGRVEGLLGNFDGDRTNDLVAGDVVLLADGRLTFEERYELLAPTWQVSEDTSLFTYRDRESPATFALNGVPAFGLYLDLLPADRRESAMRTCREAGVTDPFSLAGCALDVGVTGDESYAAEAAEAEAIAKEWEAKRLPTPPLIDAVVRGGAGAVRALLAEGVEVDAADSSGRTALLWAAYANRPQLAVILIEAGADVDHQDSFGDTALHVAANAGFDEVVEFLLGAGADKAIRNESGRTPRDLAELQGHDDLVEVLE